MTDNEKLYEDYKSDIKNVAVLKKIVKVRQERPVYKEKSDLKSVTQKLGVKSLVEQLKEMQVNIGANAPESENFDVEDGQLSDEFDPDLSMDLRRLNIDPSEIINIENELKLVMQQKIKEKLSEEVYKYEDKQEKARRDQEKIRQENLDKFIQNGLKEK